MSKRILAVSKCWVSKCWILSLAFLVVPFANAQESPFAAAMKTALIQPASPAPILQRTQPIDGQHRFMDRNNCVLFAAVGALNTADFFVTRNNLAHGGTEINPITRPFASSTSGLAVNFAAETAGSIGLSYLFHKTGHHKLERITSFVNIGGSASAVGYGLAHR